MLKINKLRKLKYQTEGKLKNKIERKRVIVRVDIAVDGNMWKEINNRSRRALRRTHILQLCIQKIQ